MSMKMNLGSIYYNKCHELKGNFSYIEPMYSREDAKDGGVS